MAEALDHIEGFYREEAVIREQGLEAEAKLAHRGEHTKPLVEAFFAWLKQTVITEVLLPSNPFGQAARYTLEREAALKVFLADPDVPMDTNHLEREIRRLRWADETGCSVGRKSAPTMLASSRVCSRPVVSKTSIPMSIWSMCSNASIPIPPWRFSFSRPACGNSTSQTTLCAQISIAPVNNAVP